MSLNYAYIVENGSNDVTVIDIPSNKIITRIDLLKGSPDDRKRDKEEYDLYSCMDYSFDFGSSPYELVITPDNNYVYVIASHAIIKIDTATNEIVSTIVIHGEGYRHIAITPDSKYAYVTNSRHNTVSVINVSTNTIISTVKVGNGPEGVAITPDGKYAYVVNYNSDDISIVDTSTNTLDNSTNVIYIDKTCGYLTNDIGTINVGRGPYGVAITPDSKYAYVTNMKSGNISVIDISTNSVIKTISPAFDTITPGDIAVTPDGKYVFFLDSSKICRITPSEDYLLNTNFIHSGLYGMAITPDSEYVYVTNQQSGRVYVVIVSRNVDRFSFKLGRMGVLGIAITQRINIVYPLR